MQAKEFHNLNDDSDQIQWSQPPRKYGNYIVLCRDASHEPLYMLGPHWYIFIFSIVMSTGLLVWMLISIRNLLHPALFIVLCVCTVLNFLAYLNIGLSNPGFAVPILNPTYEQKNNEKFCNKCGTLRCRKIYHCQDCDICIQGYDHHCPWIGKCVGRNNIISFYIFLSVLFGTLIICLIGAIASNPNKKGMQVTKM